MSRYALSRFILIDDQLIKFLYPSPFLTHILKDISLDLLPNWTKNLRHIFFFLQSIDTLIRVPISIMLSPPPYRGIPFPTINFLKKFPFLFLSNKLSNIPQTFYFINSIIFLHFVSLIMIKNMIQNKKLIQLLFSSWNRTHQLSSRIMEHQIRRNHIKRLEGNYRKFQDYVANGYQSQEEIDNGLIRYHHHLAECQYRTILSLNHQLGSKSYKLNPYPRRQLNFQLNRQHKAKIDFKSFLDFTKE